MRGSYYEHMVHYAPPLKNSAAPCRRLVASLAVIGMIAAPLAARAANPHPLSVPQAKALIVKTTQPINCKANDRYVFKSVAVAPPRGEMIVDGRSNTTTVYPVRATYSVTCDEDSGRAGQPWHVEDTATTEFLFYKDDFGTWAVHTTGVCSTKSLDPVFHPAPSCLIGHRL